VTAHGQAAAPPAVDVQTWVRYTHLDHIYRYLPGIRDAQQVILGLTSEYRLTHTWVRFGVVAAVAEGTGQPVGAATTVLP
jgi:hypothetical protein